MMDQWKTDEGQNRSKLRVKADRVRFLSKNPESQKKKPDEAKVSASSANIESNTHENPPF